MSPEQASNHLLESVSTISVIPVLALNQVENAARIAQMLVAGGLSIIEVTLRTENALTIIEAMAAVEGANVGAGTVLDEKNVYDAKSAGANFIVSPGYTDELGSACEKHSIPLLPGAATPSEVMKLKARGYHFLKFFPANINGGTDALCAFSGPLPDIQFCPTGGIGEHNILDYLALSNVPCAGGSWIVKETDLERNDWSQMQNRIDQLNHIVGSK